MEHEEPVAKIQKIMLPFIGGLAELQEKADPDFAKLVTIGNTTYVVLPFKDILKYGVRRRHFISQSDKIPNTAYHWEYQGWEYLAFPYAEQTVTSVYHSSSGRIEAKKIFPDGRINYGLGETERVLETLLVGVLEITQQGEVYKVL
jgi:hypothetical protein